MKTIADLNAASYYLEGDKIIETRKGLPELELSLSMFKDLWECGKIVDSIPMKIERLISFDFDLNRLEAYYESQILR